MGRVDVIDIEYIQPEGAVGIGVIHHAADHGAAAKIELQVGTHVAHVHRVNLVPAELVPVEGERRSPILGMQLVPAAVARLARRKGCRRTAAERGHDIEQGTLRIGDHGDSPDVRQVPRGHVQRAARGQKARDARVDIGDADIAEPHRPHARFHGAGWKGHQTADAHALHAEDAVVHSRMAGIARRPAQHFAVESRSRRGIAGQQFVPDEAARHCCNPRVIAPGRRRCRLFRDGNSDFT